MDALLECREIREHHHHQCHQPARDPTKKSNSSSANASMDLARVVDAMGKVHFFQGDYKDAMECHCEALATKRRIVGDAHVSVVTSMMNIGMVHKAMNQIEKAIQIFHAVLYTQKIKFLACQGRPQQEQENDEPMKRMNLSRAAMDVGDTLRTLGELLQQKGDSQNANWMFQEAINNYENYAGLQKNHEKIVGLKWMIQS